jgi:intein/homing endonuclease
LVKQKGSAIELIMDQGTKMVLYYREHPCTAAYDLLGADLAPIQRPMFRDMWFKNYVIGVCSRGSGKSVHVNSLCHIKDKGLLYLNEELPPIPSYLKDNQEEIIIWDEKVYTSEGFKSTKQLCLEKGIQGKQLTTTNGFINKGSNHHPLLTLDSECNFIYKNMDEFKPGDRICIQRGQNIFGNNEMLIDDAYLLGLFIGDGLIVSKYVPRVTTGDDVIKEFCINYCIKNNISYRRDNDKRTENTSSICFKKFDWFFEKYKVNRVLSYYKSVPYSIRAGTRKIQIAFLQGYFDTDGTVHNANGCASCCSVSKKLLQEVQLMLLNFGIVGRIRKKKTRSKFGKAYLLDIYSNDSLNFKELIGFRLQRKQKLLETYFDVKVLNPNKDTVPYIRDICWDIKQNYKKLNAKRYNDPNLFNLPFNRSSMKEVTYSRLHKFIVSVNKVLEKGYIIDDVYLKKVKLLEELLKYNYYFDTVKSVKDWSGDCYDFEMDMDEEPNYFANGFVNHNTFLLGILSALSCMLYPGYRVGLISPVFRQSKMIFSEVEKLYSQSSIFREACEKRPIRGTDTCYVKFKAVGGMPPAFIEALPLSDGTKIRGSRFYLVCLDELAQIPNQVLDLVIRPMGAATLNPMENVHRLEKQRKLIELGLASIEDFDGEETINKMIMTSSGYYKFNHMWRRMKDHWSMMDRDGDASQYSVWQIPYWDLPEGFLDSNNIAEAKRIMSSSEFKMEYEAEMISDSEGFFKASLLEECTSNSGFSIELKGKAADQYIIGIDPNQGGNASCGILVIKVGVIKHVVNALELKRLTTQDSTKTVQKLCDDYNIVRIFMDSRGGGNALRDLLEEGYGGVEPIIDRTNPEHKHIEGRHILEMVDFNPKWIANANFTTKALLEDKKLLFPEPPQTISDLEGKLYENINTLKSQMLNIVVTQTGVGNLHFDTPRKGQNKDLYSAMTLAAHGAREFEKEFEEDVTVLYNSGGLIRERKPGATFNPIVREGPALSKTGIEAAILKGKRRIK